MQFGMLSTIKKALAKLALKGDLTVFFLIKKLVNVFHKFG